MGLKAAPQVRDYDWRDWTIDKRGCGGCTVRQFEGMRIRLLVGLLRVSRRPK